jgi:hypothetical protein
VLPQRFRRQAGEAIFLPEQQTFHSLFSPQATSQKQIQASTEYDKMKREDFQP